MYEQRLCLALNKHFGPPAEEQIGLFKRAGFDGFAIDVSDRSKNAPELAAIGKNEGMIISSLHAPFDRSADMWHGEERGDEAAAELIEYIELCARLEIPITVAHTFIGFGCKKSPTDAGIER